MSWEDTKRRFVAIALRKGMDAVARELPASRRTVYRMVNGQVDKPSLAIRVAVERIVKEDKEKP